MSLPSPERLRAATATGTPALLVIDFSLGGLLVQASEAFEIGSIVHLTLSAADGTPCGTFDLRCVHAHRSTTPAGDEAHMSALVFQHSLDEITTGLFVKLGGPRQPGPTAGGRNGLRLASPGTG